jgi:hypothetical protein
MGESRMAKKAPAAEVIDRLAMAKYQLSLCRRELESGTEFGAWQASIMLHDATETCMIAIADYCGRRAQKSKPIILSEYPNVLTQMTSGAKPFQDASAIDDVSEIRNSAKHRGQYPGLSDVRRLLDRIESMLDRNCELYVGIRLADVSLAEKVRDTELRDLLKSAERHITAGEFTDAITRARHAWLLALGRFRRRHNSRELPAEMIRSTRLHVPSKDLEQIVHELNEWWSLVRAEMDLLALGVDLLREQAFASIAPIVHLTEGGKAIVSLRGDEQIVHTAGAAHFALTFVLENVLRLQEIDRPAPHGSYYVLEVIKNTPYYDASSSEYERPAGEFLPGTRIDGAQIALGPGPDNSWSFRDANTGHTLLIPVNAATVKSFMTADEYRRAIAEAIMGLR